MARSSHQADHVNLCYSSQTLRSMKHLLSVFAGWSSFQALVSSPQVCHSDISTANWCPCPSSNNVIENTELQYFPETFTSFSWQTGIISFSGSGMHSPLPLGHSPSLIPIRPCGFLLCSMSGSPGVPPMHPSGLCTSEVVLSGFLFIIPQKTTSGAAHSARCTSDVHTTLAHTQ